MFKKIKIANEREIDFCNIPILSYGTKEEPEYTQKYLKVFPKSFEKQTFSRILKMIAKEHDLIILLRAEMGEAYLLNFMLDEIVKKTHAKHPCIVSPRKEYRSVLGLYWPDIPFYVLNFDIKKYYSILTHRTIQYKQRMFNINPSTLAELRTLLQDYEDQKTHIHYTEAIKRFNGVKDFTPKVAQVSKSIEDLVAVKTKNINKDKFIYIINDANFVEKLPPEFWSDFIEKLKQKGYDIFVNDKSLSVAESYCLANQAKAVISLRCGFLEVLSTVKPHKYVIYTPCRWHKIDNMQEIFTLKKYPQVNKKTITEYDSLKISADAIKAKILGEL
jgi:hypothetical protein